MQRLSACQVYALAIMNINPGEGLLTKLAAEATQKIGGFIAQNLSNTIWCALCCVVLCCVVLCCVVLCCVVLCCVVLCCVVLCCVVLCCVVLCCVVLCCVVLCCVVLCCVVLCCVVLCCVVLCCVVLCCVVLCCVVLCRPSILGSPCRQLSGLFMLCRRAFSTLGALNVSGVRTCAEMLAA